MMAEEHLTPVEKNAMDLTVELWKQLQMMVGDGPSRHSDLGELMTPIHQIQRAIMAQAAARAYPQHYRLLGEVIHE